MQCTFKFLMAGNDSKKVVKQCQEHVKRLNITQRLLRIC